MTTHTIRAQVEVKFRPIGMEDFEIAYPTLDIEFDYVPGRPAFTPRGEYAPIDPPDPAEVSFRSAKLIDGDGLDPFMGPLGQQTVDDWASDYLDTDEGYEAAIEAAENDRQPDPDYERDKRLDDERDFGATDDWEDF
jgi:hypothetical protein